jgi:hypothetical protein
LAFPFWLQMVAVSIPRKEAIAQNHPRSTITLSSQKCRFLDSMTNSFA